MADVVEIVDGGDAAVAAAAAAARDVALAARDDAVEARDVVLPLAEQVSDDAEQAANDRAQTGLDRTATGEDRALVAADRAAAQTARGGAETARGGAEAARDLALPAAINAQAGAAAAAASVPVTADRTVGQRPGDTGLWTVLRSTPIWVWGADGTLVEVPVDTLAWEYDRVTGGALGVAFAGQRSNAAINPRMEGGTAGVIGSGGALPSGMFLSASQAGLTREVGFGTWAGMRTMTLRLSGTATAAANTALEFVGARASAPSATPSQPRATRIWARLAAGTLANIATLRMRAISLTAAGAASWGSDVGPSWLATLDGTWRAFDLPATTINDALVARFSWGIEGQATNGTAPDLTLAIALPEDEPGARFVSGPILPAVGTPAASTRAQGTVTIPTAQFGARLHRRSGVLILDWSSQPGPFASADDADWFGLVSLGDGTTGERIGLLVNPAHTSVEARIVVGGVAGTTASRAMAAPAAGETIRCALAWDVASNRLQVAARGAAGVAVALPAMPLLSLLMPGRYATSHPLYGRIAGLDIRPAALFDAALAALT